MRRRPRGLSGPPGGLSGRILPNPRRLLRSDAVRGVDEIAALHQLTARWDSAASVELPYLCNSPLTLQFFSLS